MIAVGIAVIAAVIVSRLGDVLLIDADVPPASRPESEAIVWPARVLLLLALAWITIGAIATRTSLVRRPGAAAARSTWLASTRPWRARESILGLLPFDRALMVIVPVGLMICTRIIQASFAPLWPALSGVLAWVVFTLVAVLLVRPHSPWPMVATVGGGIVFQCVFDLACYSVAGPLTFWSWLWSVAPVLRVAVLTVVFGAMAWTAVAIGGAANAQVGPRRATGVTMAAAGSALALVALMTALWGNAMLARMWRSDVVSVSLPDGIAWAAFAVALVIAVGGVFLARRSAREPAELDR